MNSANPGIRLIERSELGLIACRCRQAAPLQQALNEAGVALEVPQPLGSSVDAENEQVLRWSTPDEWLLSCPLSELRDRVAVLKSALAESGAIVDVSGGYCLFELEGDALEPCLKKITLYDTDPRHMPVGKVVGTVIGKATGYLRRLPEGRMECIVRASFAEYTRLWIARAAQEYGFVRVDAGHDAA